MEDISPRTGDRIRSRSQGRKTFGATTTASFYTARSSSPFVETNPIELTKKRTLKKILALASIDQEVMKILKRLLELGPRSLDEKAKLKLEEKAEDVMEEDKRSELEYYIGKISHEGDSSYKVILSMFKLFIVSSEERNYIERIDEELNRGLELEDEIQDANKNLIVQREKKGKSNAIQESAESLRKEIEQYENKIEKANQKLNQSIVHNEELRRKVDHLRRDRLLIDQVYQRLEKEMVEKQEEIEATIRNAGEAYLKKDRAEEELRHLNQRSEEQRETFFNDLKGINKSIDEERHFKEFIFHKNKGKKELETLEIAIVKNQKKIEEKMKMNAKMENEYNISAKKEEEIRKAFEKIQQGTGVHAPQDVVVVFNSLHQRMTEMERYVKELSSEVNGLDRKIFDLKDQLRSYSLKGVKHDKKNAEEAEALLKKMDAEEKKRRVYKVQYRKSIETLSEHKEKIEKLFAAIGAEEKLVTKISNSTFTEQNISEFIGLLEEKGMTLINRFSRLIAQQIVLEKGSTYNIESQLEDLNNIIAYNNANTMNQRPDKKPAADVPDDVFNVEAGVDKENPLTEEQFRQVAFSMLSSTQKRSLSPGVKRVHSGKLSKFNIRSSSASKQKKGSINAL